MLDSLTAPGMAARKRGSNGAVSILPAEVAARAACFGHWQGDLLIFAQNGGSANVTTLLERRICFLVLLASLNCRPAGFTERISAALGSLDAGLCRTVTDRGCEFMGYTLAWTAVWAPRAALRLAQPLERGRGGERQ